MRGYGYGGGFAVDRAGHVHYPLKQRWFASHTQMATNRRSSDGGEAPSAKKIYYHKDSTSAERREWNRRGGHFRARDFVGTEILPGYDDSPAKPRYDVIYLLDDRGWFYRYSHLQTIDPAVRPGRADQHGTKDRRAGQGGRQRRLVAFAL